MMYMKVLFHAVLFAMFVPGALVTLPPNGSKWVVIAVHSVLFAVLSHLVYSVLFKKLA